MQKPLSYRSQTAPAADAAAFDLLALKPAPEGGGAYTVLFDGQGPLLDAADLDRLYLTVHFEVTVDPSDGLPLLEVVLAGHAFQIKLIGFGYFHATYAFRPGAEVPDLVPISGGGATSIDDLWHRASFLYVPGEGLAEGIAPLQFAARWSAGLTPEAIRVSGRLL